jgi:hypothetical protein
LAQLILVSYKKIEFALGIAAMFFALYYLMYYFVQSPILSFFTALVPSMALGFMLGSWHAGHAGKNNRARKGF